MEDVFGQEAKPEEYATDIFMIYRDSMQKQVELEAPILRRITENGRQKSVFEDGVSVTFFSKSGRPQSYLDANWAIKDDADGKIICQDEVVFRNIEGDTLVTSELIWDEKDEKLWTRKFVKIKTKKQEVLYSHGLYTDQEFSTYELNAIEGDWLIEEESEE